MAEGCSADLRDAREYVETVMNSDITPRCATPRTSRKRTLSANDMSWSELTAKKQCQEKSNVACVDKEVKNCTQAKRSLYTVSGGQGRDPDIRDSGNVVEQLSHLIGKLSDDVAALSDRLNGRIDQLETTLESRISQKVVNLLDKRINSEMSRIKKDVDIKLQAFKDDMQRDMIELDGKVQELSSVTIGKLDRNHNIVIRGLPFHEGENLNSKVNLLIKDGMKIPDLSVVSSVRKDAIRGNTPGLVIATFQSVQDTLDIFAAKKKLKDIDHYKKVFIGKDLPTQERAMNRNVKVIVDALRQSGCDITLRGNRVESHGSRQTASSNANNNRTRERSPAMNRNCGRDDTDRNSRDSFSGSSRANRDTNDRNARDSLSGYGNRNNQYSGNNNSRNSNSFSGSRSQVEGNNDRNNNRNRRSGSQYGGQRGQTNYNKRR